MIKKVAATQALAWAPQITLFTPAGVGRTDPANDEPFLPPPPPNLAARLANFGGRHRRYEVQRNQQLRIYDPFEQAFVEFGHERYMQAWLLVRFCPVIVEINATPQPVGYISGGQPTLARPHLSWKTLESNRHVCFWLRRDWSDEERMRHKIFSQTHGIDVVLATWDELDSQEQLLKNLQAGRQRMATVHHAGLDIRQSAQEILRHLKAHKGQSTRREVGEALCGPHCADSDARVDAALFYLHAAGRLTLELQSADFGDDTRVRSA